MKRKMPKSWYVRNLLCCELLAVEVQGDRVILRLPEDHCTDMSGAIELARFLCPRVRRIDTYAGAAVDTRYFLGGDRWSAILPPRETFGEAPALA